MGSRAFRGAFFAIVAPFRSLRGSIFQGFRAHFRSRLYRPWRAGSKDFRHKRRPATEALSAPSARRGRAAAEQGLPAKDSIMHACSVHALLALAVLLLIVVAPRAMTHACCCGARADLVALGLAAALCAIASARVVLAPLAALASLAVLDALQSHALPVP